MHYGDNKPKYIRWAIFGVLLTLSVLLQNSVLLLLFVGTLDSVDKCSIYCLRAKLQGSQQVLDLPKVEYILGDILFAFLKCYKHSYNQSEVLSTLLGALGTLLK